MSGRWRRLTLSVLLAAAAGTPALAPRSYGVDPPVFTSASVEHLGTVGVPGAVFGGTVHDGYLYVPTSVGLVIFKTGGPEAPLVEVGRLDAPTQSLAGPNEKPATNGRVLLLNVADSLWVVDVRDKARPQRIALLPDRTQHTWTCLFDCRYAYGSGGLVLDLRDPARAAVEGGSWTAGLALHDWDGDGPAPGYGVHDVTEVAPGLVLTASIPMHLLEVDEDDPVEPRSIATSPISPHTSHSNAWPNGAEDAFVITVNESVNPHCATRPAYGAHDALLPFRDSAVHTWDARDWRRTGTLRSADTYRVRSGTFSDGQPPVGGTFLGCAMHWFDPHPDWRDGGVLAEAAYAHGVRFLHVDQRGDIEETGWFLPVHANTQTVFWGDGGLVYALDLHRGIDVLRYKGAVRAAHR